MTSDILTGEQSESTFKFDNGILRVEEDNEILEFTEAGYFDPTPGCGSVHSINSVVIQVNLAFLPNYVTINS